MENNKDLIGDLNAGLDNNFGFNGGEVEQNVQSGNVDRLGQNGNANFNNTHANPESVFRQPAGGSQEIMKMLGNFDFTYRGNDILDSTLADGKEALSMILDAMIKDKNLGKFKVIPIEKTEANILYSSVVLAGKLNGSNVINYTVLILTKTGRAELTAKDILAATQRSQNPHYRFDKKAVESIAREIAFPRETFDSVFHQPFVVAKIKQEFNATSEKIQYVNLNVFDSDQNFFVETKEGKKPSPDAIEIFKSMFNPIVYLDPALQKTIEEADFTLVPFINTGTKINHEVVVGQNSQDGKIRSDVAVKLKATFNYSGQNNVDSINKQPLEKEFVKTDVYVTPTYTRRAEFDPATGRNIEVNRVQPVLVISNIQTPENTLRFVLGGIVAALPMMNDTMFPYAVLKSPSNWGNLGVYESSDVANYAGVIDFKSPEFSEEEVISLIDATVAKDKAGNASAMLAIEVSANTKSFGMSVIRDAMSENPNEAQAGGKAIINALHKITGGRFPVDFHPLQIFQTTTVAPEGYFVNKTSGERVPLSTFDITNVIEAKVDPQMVYSYNLGEYNNSKLDAYMNKLDALDKIGVGSAVITDKTFRGFFSEAFIIELEKAIKSVGLSIFVSPLVTRANIGKFEGLSGYNGLSFGYTSAAHAFNEYSRFNTFDKGVAYRQY